MFIRTNTTVNSVLGSLSPHKLGWTLVHEHFLGAYPNWVADATMAPYDRKACLKRCLNKVELLRDLGILTIIDPVPNDQGARDTDLWAEIAQRTGVNVIGGTGLHNEAEGAPLYWKTQKKWGKDIVKMISELMIKEIKEGIVGTGIKAGVISVASGDHMTDYEADVHRAAVVAQKVTGMPIVTHTGVTGGIEQAQFLISEGADPRKTMIGHVTNNGDVGYHRAILATGVSLGFDRLGMSPLVFGVADADQARNVATLCQEGYANRIMLSNDCHMIWLGRFGEGGPDIGPGSEGSRIGHVVRRFIPLLRECGVTDDQINAMMVENTKGLFLNG